MPKFTPIKHKLYIFLRLRIASLRITRLISFTFVALGFLIHSYDFNHSPGSFSFAPMGENGVESRSIHDRHARTAGPMRLCCVDLERGSCRRGSPRVRLNSEFVRSARGEQWGRGDATGLESWWVLITISYYSIICSSVSHSV